MINPDHLKPEIIAGRARTEKDRLALDIIYLHDRITYLKKRLADKYDWQLERELRRKEKELLRTEKKYLAEIGEEEQS